MARLNKTSGQAQAGGGEVVSLDEPLLDCAAAAALLNVRVSWVRDAARLGHLPCVRVGRHLRFTRVMLEDWLWFSWRARLRLGVRTRQRPRRPVRTRVSSGAAPRRRCWRAWRRCRMALRLTARGSDFCGGSGTRPRLAWWISAAAAGAALWVSCRSARVSQRVGERIRLMRSGSRLGLQPGSGRTGCASDDTCERLWRRCSARRRTRSGSCPSRPSWSRARNQSVPRRARVACT